MTPHEKFYRKFRKPQAGRTLIVGSRLYGTREDRRKLYPDVIGIDMLDGPGVDLVCDLEDSWYAMNIGTFDHIECRSVLEHSRRPWLLAANIERLMAPGATLDLSVPFVWRVHAYPSDYYRFTIEAVRELFPNIEWKALMYATDKMLSKGAKLNGMNLDGGVHLARCEVLGFGTRK